MADATAQIRIDIVATGAEAGANRVNAALDRVGQRGRSVQAANDNLRGTFDRLGNSMGGAAGHGGRLGAIFDNIRERASGAAPEIANLTGTLAKFGPMAGVIAGVALAIGAVSVKAVEAAAKVEMWKANLLTITGSAQKAEESYAALVDFATKTPFDLGQAVEGFTKLRTLGLQATEGALMSFGNTAAAMGKPLSQMIEAVADAATGEFERLKEFGIKSKQEGDKVKFTFGGVTTSVGKDAASIQKYLENLGNTKFGGAMARQMDTIKGAMSNVEDAIFQAFAAIGGGALGASVKEMLKSISAGVSAATPMLAAMGNVIGSIVGAVGNVLNSLGNLWLSLHGGASAGSDMLTGLTVTFNLVAQGVEVFGNVVSAVFGAMAGVVNGVLGLFSDGFSTLFNWMGVSFETSGRSWSNSIVGILRAVKAVVTAMPNLFAIAINDVMRMFRDLGSGIAAFLSGDFKKGMGFFNKEQFGNTGKAVAALGTIAVATANDVKGADAAIGRLLGRNKVKPKLDVGPVVKPTPSGGTPDKDKETEAEKRAKQEADFWKTLQGEVDTAKLLPIEAENYRKQLELAKIVGDKEAETQKGRLADLMQQARTAKFLTDALDKHNQTSRDIAGQEEMLRQRINGATEQQLAVEKKVIDFRNAAVARGVDLQSDAYKASEAQLRADETRLGLIDQQNKKLDEQAAKMKDMARDGFQLGTDALRSHGSIADRQGAAKADYDKQIASLKAALDSKDPDTKLSPAAFQAGVKRAGEEFRETMAEIGDEFSQKMGRIGDFLSNIGSMIGGKLGSLFNEGGNLARGIGDFQKTKTDIAEQFGQAFGSNSPFLKGMGKAVGGAMAGLQIGESIAGLGKALGLKMSSTGSKIGGAIGGAAFGPIGSVVGSIAGGLLGGLFKKTKYGTASLTGAGDPVVSGRGSAQKKAASGAAGSVQEGLAKLAAELGGAVGNYSVAIGQYDGKWRVRDDAYSGALKFKGSAKNGLHDFGKDGEAEAIAYAIENAIKDGAITGLAPIIQRALNGLGADAAVQFAKDWTAAMADYKSLTDPVGAVVDGIVKPLDALKATMLQVGASSEDMGKFEAYRALKLNAALKEQVSGFQSLLDDLNGDAGGVTALAQLTANLAKLDTFKADIAAGKTVDQDAFTDLAGKVLSGAGDVYGTNTTQFQDIIGSLKGLTTGAMGNATNAFNAAAGNPTAAAIADQTNALTAQQGITNDYLRQIAEAVQQGGVLGSYMTGESNVIVKNGRLVQAF